MSKFIYNLMSIANMRLLGIKKRYPYLCLLCFGAFTLTHASKLLWKVMASVSGFAACAYIRVRMCVCYCTWPWKGNIQHNSRMKKKRWSKTHIKKPEPAHSQSKWWGVNGLAFVLSFSNLPTTKSDLQHLSHSSKTNSHCLLWILISPFRPSECCLQRAERQPEKLN